MLVEIEYGQSIRNKENIRISKLDPQLSFRVLVRKVIVNIYTKNDWVKRNYRIPRQCGIEV